MVVGRKKGKGWRGDMTRHSQAAKRGWPRRRYSQERKAAMTRLSKKEAIKLAKKAYRRKRGMPEGDGK